MQDQIVAKIRDAGVVGAGGAGLPTHIKAAATVDTVLVNGASCEPLLMSDPYLLEAEIDTVVRGLEYLMDCVGARRGILCLKGKHQKALEVVQNRIATDATGRLDFFELEDFYPAGDEQVLVREVLGRTIPERGLPLQVGAVVSNVESLLNIAFAMDGQPVTHRYLTVAGEVKNPMVVKAPVGALVRDVLAFAGGTTIADYKVVDGGPMMGKVLADAEQSVTKTTSGLLVLPADHNVVVPKTMKPERLRRITNSICCQCSLCTDLCPRNLLGHSLHPHKLMRISSAAVLSSASSKEALLCSECGVCEKFACPMGVSPREVNAQIKKVLMSNGVTWEAQEKEYTANPFRRERAVPTTRLLQRLNLTRYAGHFAFAGELPVHRVCIPLHQHIGAAAICIVSAGDSVSCGDVLGKAPEGTAMAARVHASIDGVVESVVDGKVTIKAQGKII